MNGIQSLEWLSSVDKYTDINKHHLILIQVESVTSVGSFGSVSHPLSPTVTLPTATFQAFLEDLVRISTDASSISPMHARCMAGIDARLFCFRVLPMEYRRPLA